LLQPASQQLLSSTHSSTIHHSSTCFPTS
jgi:hypothetical protein